MVWYGDQKGRANGTWDLQEVLQSRAGDATTLTASPWLTTERVCHRLRPTGHHAMLVKCCI